MTKVVRKLRCAVYTRKSSEEGLEKEFNSLHAQREACEAYIASQKPEGWVLVRERYEEKPIFMRYLIAASGDQLFPEGGGMVIRDSSGHVIGAVGVTGDTEDRDEALAVHGIHAVGLKTDEDFKDMGRHVGYRR